MKLPTQLSRAEQEIRNIATADDLDSALRHAALERLSGFIAAQRKAIDERNAAHIEALDHPPEQPAPAQKSDKKVGK